MINKNVNKNVNINIIVIIIGLAKVDRLILTTNETKSMKKKTIVYHLFQILMKKNKTVAYGE